MGKWNEFVQKIKENPDFKELRKSSFRDILNGNILTKQVIRKQFPLLVMLVLLALLYIDNRYASERQLRASYELQKQIQDAKYVSLSISADLMDITRQSNITTLLKEKGLELELGEEPPVVIHRNTRH